MTIRTILRATLPALALTLAIGGVAQAKHKKATTDTTTTQPATSQSSTNQSSTSSSSTSKSTMSHHSRLPGYKTASEASKACGGDVVWHARGSKAFHDSKSKYYGKTKHGSYVCQKAALADHLHQAKN